MDSEWDAIAGQVALLDRNAVIVWANRAWVEQDAALGGAALGSAGANYLGLCDRAARAGRQGAAEAAELVRLALAGGGGGGGGGGSGGDGGTAQRRTFCVEAPLACADAGADVSATRRQGQRLWLGVKAFPLADSGGTLVVQEDVSAEKELECELRHRAFHDPLTGLPNRALLADRLEHAVSSAARDPGSLAVLFVDLDDFKRVNDRFGHLVGDTVLRRVATLLADSVRASDTVGRWGGDEFVIVAERLDGSFTVDHLVQRVRDSLREALPVAGEHLTITPSVGVARLADHEGCALVEAADQALIAERTQRRGRVKTASQRGSVGRSLRGEPV
jgi:diguanylate cyclase (GGDEF)-like protein